MLENDIRITGRTWAAALVRRISSASIHTGRYNDPYNCLQLKGSHGLSVADLFKDPFTTAMIQISEGMIDVS